MENSLKALILAAGTVITCVVITLGFYLSKEAQSTASTGQVKLEKLIQSLQKMIRQCMTM